MKKCDDEMRQSIQLINFYFHFPIRFFSNASRKVQSNVAHLFRSSEEYDERIDDE